MKKNHWYLMSLMVFMLSCKKEHTNNVVINNGPHKITYNVGFSQSSISINSTKLQVNSSDKTAHAVDDLVDVMYFAVYNSGGNNVHTRRVIVNNDTYTYVDTLAPGKYTLVVAAGKTGFQLARDIIPGIGHGVLPAETPTSQLGTDVLKYSGTFTQDAFYKKIPLTVTNSDFSQNISLDRITSQIEVNIEDAIPANAKTAFIYMHAPTQIGYKFYIGSGTAALPLSGAEGDPNGDYSSAVTILPADIGTVNYKLYSTPFLYISPFTVNLYFVAEYNSFNNLGFLPMISQKVIPNVNGAINTRTVLTGNMFGGNPANGSGSFHIFLDTAWNSTQIIKKFP
ncbi:FimB/Mfa2 family fimbrial subunit [Mucilaginibacter lappiensis]|jgi:hypothetical protein|uniref:FimB/Mfa2 family fimbrial subunit n=1 Tax=Mucilaginibacter lappiensis TaxID=354630 RepID=UPI003D200002